MVLIKLLLILVLLYFIAKSIGNLARAVLHGPQSSGRVQSPPGQEREPQWQGPSPVRTPLADEDIEDARWEDLG